MSCGVGCSLGLDPALLWLWCRLAAIAQVGPLAWEPLCAAGAALKSKKKKKKKKTKWGKKKKKKKKKKNEMGEKKKNKINIQKSIIFLITNEIGI